MPRRIDAEIADARARKFDNVSQLQAMDREGLDVAALYPSIGLGIMMREQIIPSSPPRSPAPTTTGFTISARPIPSDSKAWRCFHFTIRPKP